MEDNNTTIQPNDNKSKKGVYILAWVLILVILAGAWGYFYFNWQNSLNNTNKVKITKDKIDKKENTVKEKEVKSVANPEQDQENLTVKDEELKKEEEALAKESEKNAEEYLKNGWLAKDPAEIPIDETTNNELKDKIDKINEIPDDKLTDEEKKLKSIVNDLSKDDSSKEELEKVAEIKVIEVWKENAEKFRQKGEKLLFLPEDVIKIEKDIDWTKVKELALSDKALKKYWIERDSIIEEIISANLNTNKNTFEGVDIKMWPYAIVIDKEYKVVKFKKDWKVIEKSPIIWISVFSIDDLYKAQK